MAILSKKLAIAVDLGATNLRVALVSHTGKILKKLKEKTAKTGKDGSVVTNQIIRLIHEVTKNTSLKKIAGIGIASIGPLDYKRGGPVHSPNIPFPFIPLIQPIQKAFSLSVALNNDANAAALAERYFGAGKHLKNLAYITISTGIGGGAIVDGNLLLGKGGNAAEIGHMIVDTSYDLLCTCKKGVGHWEALASGTNIPRFFQAWAQKNKKSQSFSFATAKDVFAQANKRKPIILEFLDDLAKVNATAISNIIVAYDPELITIGGSVALNNPNFTINGINKYVNHYLKLPKIQITKLGEDIGLLGTAAAAFQK